MAPTCRAPELLLALLALLPSELCQLLLHPTAGAAYSAAKTVRLTSSSCPSTDPWARRVAGLVSSSLFLRLYLSLSARFFRCASELSGYANPVGSSVSSAVGCG